MVKIEIETRTNEGVLNLKVLLENPETWYKMTCHHEFWRDGHKGGCGVTTSPSEEVSTEIIIQRLKERTDKLLKDILSEIDLIQY